MLLEDFYDATAFRAFGVPERDDWIDEIRHAAAAESWWAAM